MELITPKSGYTFAHLKFKVRSICLQKSVLMDLEELED